MNNPTKKISKTLSSNDTGSTGGHQAGILVPKEEEILSFFPQLDPSKKNPRIVLIFHDENNERWEFAFIYYNNRFFGGTRNEYRLTRMTNYIKSNNLKSGDEILLSNEDDGLRRISVKRKSSLDSTSAIRLTGNWKVVRL